MNLPFSPSADRNKQPILKELQRELGGNETVLEFGAGTGQHACFFAGTLPDIIWQPSDLPENLPNIACRIEDTGLGNVRPPLSLDIESGMWPIEHADACYTCNTLHIISANAVDSLLQGCVKLLPAGGKLMVYGPFSINGKHTSPGNEVFDQQLRHSDPSSGIRNLQSVDQMAHSAGFAGCRYTALPANNLFVVWQKPPL